MKSIRRFIIWTIIITAGWFIVQHYYQEKVLTQIIARLEADSRAAEAMVVDVKYDQASGKNLTTIKFLEYDTQGKAMKPRYFTFPGNLIQFQSLVVRFDDKFVAAGDRLRGKSVYLFWKVFYLDGANTMEIPLISAQEIPGGYEIKNKTSIWEDFLQQRSFESQFWQKFWNYAFDKVAASQAGVKNVQVEAPGAVFIPGYVYTIKIEHDGGLRIDTTPVPGILKGEKIIEENVK